MAQLHAGLWTPTAEQFVQHQLAHVSNFWKLGLPAEFHLVSRNGEMAELKLSFSLHAAGDPIPPPCGAPNPAFHASGRESLKKASQSRLQRSERRAAERAAAAKLAGEKVAEKVSEKKSAEELAIVKADVAEEAATEDSIAEEDVMIEAEAEKTSAVKQAETTAVEEVGDGATTSCMDSKVQCWNCNAAMTPSHQCDVPKEPVIVVEEQPPPLPLCHYCCHRGSGEHPVHYFMQCLCNDSDCSCVCYCTDEQIEHKKLFYPGGFGGKVPVSPSERPAAMSVAEARTLRLRKHSACTASTCVKWWLEDNARCK